MRLKLLSQYQKKKNADDKKRKNFHNFPTKICK